MLAWADTRNGMAQHDSVSHALATIERLGYESGLWDTYIRTDSNIASYHPLKTTGQPASGGPSFSYCRRDLLHGPPGSADRRSQKADLLKFVHDDGKGFVAAHVGLTALMSWPEFGEMLGGQFPDHPYGSVAGTVINEDPTFPATKHLPASFNLTDEFYQVKNFSREKSRVLLRLDTSKLPPNDNLINKDGDFPLAWAKMYGQGRVFYGSFAHDAKTWDNPDIYHMYFEALQLGSETDRCRRYAASYPCRPSASATVAAPRRNDATVQLTATGSSCHMMALWRYRAPRPSSAKSPT